jgi:hypothetical protein
MLNDKELNDLATGKVRGTLSLEEGVQLLTYLRTVVRLPDNCSIMVNCDDGTYAVVKEVKRYA